MSDATAYEPAAVDANQAGRLSDDQRRAWRGMSRGYRKGELSFAAVLVVIGALVAFAPGPAKYATVKPIIGAVCFVIAALLVVRSIVGGDSLTEDVRSGRVESIEGAVTKVAITSQGGRGGGMTTHYLDVAGKRLEVGLSGYQAAPEAGYVRVYYFPRSRKVVNFVHLPDPAVPDLSSESAKEVLQSFAAGVHAHSEVATAEARAQMAAMGSQFQQQLHDAAIPPPPEKLDQRPLAEAIIGTWGNAFLTLSFTADGTATSTLMNGRQTSGRWSVDAQGHLHASVAGKDQAGEAWVTGDTLTVSVDGRGLAFERKASG